MTRELTGLAFPFRIDRGHVAAASGFDKVQQDIRHLLATRLGERAMLRAYGGGLHHRLQDPNDATLRAFVGHEIDAALRTYAPDARLSGPVAVEGSEGELRVTVDYVADPRETVRRFEIAIPAEGAAT